MPLRRLFLPLLLALSAAAHADDAADVQRLVRSGDLAAALQRAEQAVAAAPQDAGLRFQQGVILMDLQRDAAAMAVFERLTQDFPELPEPYNNIALLQARAGHLEAARSALQAALRADPGQLVARQNLGDIELRLAVQDWQTAADAQPDDFGLVRKLRLARELIDSGR